MMNKLKNMVKLLLICMLLFSANTEMFAQKKATSTKKGKNPNKSILIKNSMAFNSYHKLIEYKDFKISGYKLENTGVKNNFSFISKINNIFRLDLDLGKVRNTAVESDSISWSKLGGIKPLALDSFNKFILYIFKYATYNPMAFFNNYGYYGLKNEKEVIGSDECYVLMPDNKTEIYISVKDYRVVKLRSFWNFGKEDDLIEMFFEDYQTFGLIKIPKIIYAFAGAKDFRFFVENVEFNLGFLDSDFSKPN